MSGLVLLIARHARAAARRVRYARSHFAALAVLLAGAANDSAVTLGWSRLPYLLDGAFFIAVAILGVVMTRRWADDLRALDRALESRDEFIAIASHELKTPLTPLTLQVQLVRRKLAAEESVQGDWLDQQLKMLARQVDRLGRLVNELLEFSRFERGRLRLELEEVDLATVVREAVAQLQETSAARGASEIRLQVDGPARGRWDPVRLSQIVVNLVDNAIKYGEGKPIDLVVQSSPQATIISVSDRGIGISAEHQARIFDKFERAVPAGQYGGLGLGLYITRQIVEALGGSIRVTSRPGGGTTFTVTLPDGDGARRPG
jgi:signal transduction histidine kinase